MTEAEFYQAGLYARNSLVNPKTLEWAGMTFEYDVIEYGEVNCECCGQSLVEKDTKRFRIYGTDWQATSYIPDNEHELVWVLEYLEKYGKLPPCKLNVIHVHYGYQKQLSKRDGEVF